MSTSDGRCFSKASISGALHEVWPPTMAPILVAGIVSRAGHIPAEHQGEHTWTIFSDDTVNVLGFNTVNDVVTGSRYEMAVGEHVNTLLSTSKQLFFHSTMYK
jgi:hypothetical protein